MSEKIICKNKSAFFQYQIIETFEAGLVLVGSEVKALRDGKANLSDAYATHKDGEIWLINSHISEYDKANTQNHEPKRKRKLLMHKREIVKLIAKLKEKGLTLIPIKMYFKAGKAKLELGLAKGKKLFDKRKSIKDRENKRQMDRLKRR
ncbi:SsrA-binding protein SmpB [bacterium]|nr:SsrA-binding protein SmpB [bacterium]